jgi:hypothetical protein
MSAVRSFFVGTLKIVLAIVLSASVLSALGWIAYEVYDGRQKAKNEALAIPKVWREISLSHMENATLTLRTKWEDGRMAYQFKVVGYPKKVGQARDRGPELKFILSFKDSDNFRVFDLDVPLGEMVGTVDKEGKQQGLYIEGSKYASADEYRRAITWTIQWNF